MTDVATNQEQLDEFYTLYHSAIKRQESPAITPQLAAIFTEMQNKVKIAFEAIGDEPNSDPAMRRRARQKLGLPPSEDDHDDGASAVSGFSAASASSTISAGGTRRDPLWRFRAVIMCLKSVFEHMSLQSGKHAFSNQ